MEANRARRAGGARLQVLAAAILFSTGGAVIKATGFTGWQVASFRCGVAALAILLLVPAARRGWSSRTPLVGFAYAGALVTYALANKLTTAANTIFLYSTTPLYILVLGPLLLGERLRRRDSALVAAFAAGLTLVFLDTQSVFETAPHPARGNILAALGGVSFALAVIGLRWLSRSDPPGRSSAVGAVVAGNLIAFLVTLPAALPLGSTSLTDWSLITYLGVFQIGLAYFLLTTALRRVPALEASLLLLLEPVLNPLWAWWLHGERPGPRSLAGGVVILTATIAMTLISFRAARQPDQTSRPTGQ